MEMRKLVSKERKQFIQNYRAQTEFIQDQSLLISNSVFFPVHHVFVNNLVNRGK